MAYLHAMNKRKNRAAQSLAARRMVMMTPEQRQAVARRAGIASGRARRKARDIQAEEPEPVSP